MRQKTNRWKWGGTCGWFTLPTRDLSTGGHTSTHATTAHLTSHTTWHTTAWHSARHTTGHATSSSRHRTAAHGCTVLAHAHAAASGWHGHATATAHATAHASTHTTAHTTAHAAASCASTGGTWAGPLYCRNEFMVYAWALFTSGYHAVYYLTQANSVDVCNPIFYEPYNMVLMSWWYWWWW